MKFTENKYLICLAGPTAIGKTNLAIKIAKYFDCEIFSADSRQVYKEMHIGTAKPSLEEMQGIKHHFIDHISIHDTFNTGIYEQELIKKLHKYFTNHKIALMTGGTGLYFKAVIDGLDQFPIVSEQIINKITEDYHNHGLNYLQESLEKYDPDYYNLVDKQNPHRLIRALSIYHQSGKTYSSFLSKPRKKRSFQSTCLYLNMPREELYDRINRRVDIMIEKGLIEEARSLYPYKSLPSLQTVGYKELFIHFDGKIDLKSAIERIKQHSRQYAKRQLTWFRNDPRWIEFQSDQFEKIIQYISEKTK